MENFEMLNNRHDSVFRSGYVTIALTLFCLLSVIYGFWFLKFGFDINDEAYQTMNAMNPVINPQAILSSFLSNVWGRMFGFSFHSMRILTFCLNIMSLGAAVCFLYWKTHNKNLSLLLFGMLVCISLCLPNKSRLIGWDCYAIFFTTLSLILMVKMWNGAGVKSLLLLGLLSGCAILARFPDVVIVPVAILCIFISDIRKKWLSLTIYLCSVLLSVAIILCVIYHGEVFQWFTDLKSSFVSGHGIKRLIGAYLHSGKLELVDIILLSIVLLVKYKFVKTEKYSVLFNAVLSVVLIAILVLKLDRVYYPVNRLLSSGIIISLALYVINAKRTERFNHLFRSLVIFGCCLVPMAGSDGGTSKLMNLSVLPVVFALFELKTDEGVSKSDRDFVSVLWMILVSCTVIMPFYTANHTTFDGGWKNAGFAVNHVLLKDNTTTHERATEIDEMLEAGATVLPEDFVVIGHNNRRFFSEYLLGHRNKLWPHSWSDKILEEQDKIDLLLDKINSQEIHDIVFVKYGANGFADFDRNPMRSAIESTGYYEISDNKWFVICKDRRIR